VCFFKLSVLCDDPGGEETSMAESREEKEEENAAGKIACGLENSMMERKLQREMMLSALKVCERLNFRSTLDRIQKILQLERQ
jgi:hypothetical protein